MRFVLVALLIAGCGDNIGAVPFADYAAAAREAQCIHDVTCGVLTNESDCEWAELGSFEYVQSFKDSYAAGRIAWHAREAFDCLAHADQWSCDRAVHDPWCDEPLWEGRLHDGEACNWDGECISSECWDGGTGTCHEEICPGVCVGDARPVPGHIYDGCRYSRCLEGWCDGNICQPFVPDGDTCKREAECELGSSCSSSGASSGRCARLPDTGEACVHACRRVGDVCPSTTNTCQAVKLGGEACISSQECSPFYTCDTSLTCVPRKP